MSRFVMTFVLQSSENSLRKVKILEHKAFLIGSLD